jgi:biotin transport system substrate-specific component
MSENSATVTSAQAGSRTRYLVVSALLAALLAASAWISIPVGAVPVTLQVCIVILCGLLLPASWAAVPVIVYAVLGAIGVPVFSGGQGGLGVLVGPTGGYVLGFVLAAPVVAVVRGALKTRVVDVAADFVAALAGVLCIYALGWPQLAWVTGTSLQAAFIAGVLPFIAVDLFKAAAAVIVARALRRAGY